MSFHNFTWMISYCVWSPLTFLNSSSGRHFKKSMKFPSLNLSFNMSLDCMSVNSIYKCGVNSPRSQLNIFWKKHISYFPQKLIKSSQRPCSCWFNPDMISKAELFGNHDFLSVLNFCTKENKKKLPWTLIFKKNEFLSQRFHSRIQITN